MLSARMRPDRPPLRDQEPRPPGPRRTDTGVVQRPRSIDQRRCRRCRPIQERSRPPRRLHKNLLAAHAAASHSCVMFLHRPKARKRAIPSNKGKLFSRKPPEGEQIRAILIRLRHERPEPVFFDQAIMATKE